MATSLGPADDIPAGPINEQPIEHRLHPSELPRDLLPQGCIVAQGLRRNTANQSLGSVHELIEFDVRPNVQMPEPGKEFLQVVDRTVAEDLGLAIVAATEPFGQMANEFGELFGECLLG